MQPRKTDLARDALQAHRAPLDMRQRRLLILCDGQRDLSQLAAMIGPEASAMVIQLIQSGYLVSTAPPEPVPAAEPVAATAAGPAPGSAAPVTERRRSLVAARIYLLGILELQRHPQAAALLYALQQARSDEQVVAALRSALDALPGLTSAGYCERVRQRLFEVLPETHLAQLEQAGADAG
ncbi:hypothetical protein [Stenotrophomonas sp. PS02300]|uniref:hypothetical protein n=1 Tax=Stenotrophomonas sp. PS02300 TaxID=2991426 RepID=UPI00249B4205|nr:hypothetical protein [Stenotrophomonas sp. PS02300]